MGTTLHNKIPLGRTSLLGARRIAALLGVAVAVAGWLVLRAWR